MFWAFGGGGGGGGDGGRRFRVKLKLKLRVVVVWCVGDVHGRREEKGESWRMV